MSALLTDEDLGFEGQHHAEVRFGVLGTRVLLLLLRLVGRLHLLLGLVCLLQVGPRRVLGEQKVTSCFYTVYSLL